MIDSLIWRIKAILKKYPFFIPYFNYYQWYIRGNDYYRRDISNCYLAVYNDLAEIALNDRPSTILEFGCGDAYLLRTIHARGTKTKLYGCDFSRSQIKIARTLLPEAVIEVQNIVSTTYCDNAFDVAIGVSVLMYLNPTQLAAALLDIRRISRRIVLVEYNCLYFDEEQLELFHTVNDGRFDHDYEKECAKAGFRNIRVRRCEQFWNPEINSLGEMGHSLVTADSD